MSEAMARIQFEVRHMNHMVDLFLLSATAVNQQLEATEHVSMARCGRHRCIRRYPFAASTQRDAVKVDIRADFTFAGQHELSVVILLNLLRNALKALHRAGKGRIRIVVDGARARSRACCSSTPAAASPRRSCRMIFQRFYSYPPSSGSGIGLALCKEIIDAWQASIRCHLARKRPTPCSCSNSPQVQLAAPAPALAASTRPVPPCPSPSTTTPA